MHRQANFYAANWPKGTTVAEDGQVFAFYFPAKDTTSKPVLGGGEFILAFSDKPEVQAFQTFLSTPYYANMRAQDATPSGGWVSANNGLTPDQPEDPDRQALRCDPAGPEGGVPVRRFGPDAGCGGLRRLLEAGDGLDHGSGHEEHGGQDRGRLAEVLTGPVRRTCAARAEVLAVLRTSERCRCGAPSGGTLRTGSASRRWVGWQRSASSARCSWPSRSSSPSSVWCSSSSDGSPDVAPTAAVAIAFSAGR